MDARIPIQPSKAWILGLCPDDVEPARLSTGERRDHGQPTRSDPVGAAAGARPAKGLERPRADEVVS